MPLSQSINVSIITENIATGKFQRQQFIAANLFTRQQIWISGRKSLLPISLQGSK